MKRGMTIEYLKCRADLNFEVGFGVSGAICTNVTYSRLKYKKITLIIKTLYVDNHL